MSAILFTRSPCKMWFENKLLYCEHYLVPEFLILVPWKQLPNEKIFKKYRKMRSQGGPSCSKSMASWNPYQPAPRYSQPTKNSNCHSEPPLRRIWLLMIRIFTAFRITRPTPFIPLPRRSARQGRGSGKALPWGHSLSVIARHKAI
jgi:hypothetical protein